MRQKDLRMGLAWGLMSILISVLCFVSIRPAPVFALSLDDYFSYSLDVEFSETDIRGTEIFYATVEGTATCEQDLPLTVTEARITSRIVAQHQVSGAKVTLNSGYDVEFGSETEESFPNQEDETSQASTVVSLRFPWTSKSGIYDIVGELIEAKIQTGLGELDVTSYLPSSQALGVVTYEEGGGGGGGIRRDIIVGTDVRLLGYTDEDGNLTITIPEGTIALDEDGNPLENLEVVVDESPPDPPEDAYIIGLAYDLGPDGATFAPPITLTFTYDPDGLPEGIVKEDLVIAYYDEDTGEWVELNSTVDPVSHTIKANVDYFAIFAVIAPILAAPPPPLEPAAFTSSSLSISPLEVDIGKTVAISVLVTNTGEEEGSDTVTLKINGVIEETKEIALAGGAGKTVTFTTDRDKAGTCSVDVDGLTGFFTVKEAAPALPAAPPVVKPINWWLIGGIIAGVIIVGVFPWWFTTHRRAQLARLLRRRGS